MTSVEIRLNYITNPGEKVCIAGTMFDDWEPQEMKPCANYWWNCEVKMPNKCVDEKNNSAVFEYKFVVTRPFGNDRWEECGNRVVSVKIPKNAESLVLTDCWSYPLESKLEVVGDNAEVQDVVATFAEKSNDESFHDNTVAVKNVTAIVENKSELVVEEKKPQPVVEEKKPQPVVEEKKPQPVVEEKKPQPVVEKKPQPVVEEKKKPQPVVEEKKKSQPVVEEKEKKPQPVVEKKAVAEKKPAAEMKKPQAKPVAEEQKRETVSLKHVVPKEKQPEAKPQKVSGHKKRESYVEECKKVFEPEGTPVTIPEFLRTSRKGQTNSARRLAQYK